MNRHKSARLCAPLSFVQKSQRRARSCAGSWIFFLRSYDNTARNKRLCRFVKYFGRAKPYLLCTRSATSWIIHMLKQYFHKMTPAFEALLC